MESVRPRSYVVGIKYLEWLNLCCDHLACFVFSPKVTVAFEFVKSSVAVMIELERALKSDLVVE